MSEDINLGFIPNEKLKIEANKIFGGLIKSAWIDSDSPDYFLDNLDVDKNEEIRFDASIFILEFNNGTMVKFESSEWGSIEKLNKN